MNKKIIVFTTIAILILNTFYWINSIAQISEEYKWRDEWGYPPLDVIDWKAVREGEKKYHRYTFSERLLMSLERWELSKGVIAILIITDAVLISVAFIIIFLHKDEIREVSKKNSEQYKLLCEFEEKVQKSDKQVYEKYLKDRKKEKDI